MEFEGENLRRATGRAYTADQMRQAERQADEEYGVSLWELMLRAGKGLAGVALAIAETAGITNVQVFCGSGNNGGDGYICALELMSAGIRVTAVEVGHRSVSEMSELAGRARALYEESDGKIIPPGECESEGDTLAIDALFGIGLSRPITGEYADAVARINGAKTVLSCDIPSGVYADTGEIEGPTVQADNTAVMGLLKPAALLSPGCHYFGEISICKVLPPELEARYSGDGGDTAPYAVKYNRTLGDLLPPRDPDSHKYDYGCVMMVCGREGYTGSAALAARAALRAGAGYVNLAVPRCIYPIIAAKLDEPCVYPVPDNGSGGISRYAANALTDMLVRADSLVIGPGMGRGEDNLPLLRELLEMAKVPVVIDADGINTLADEIGMLEKDHPPVILTPHSGELSRLLHAAGIDEKNRLDGAKLLADRLGAVIVVKGNRTVTVAPGGVAAVNTCGNPGMAKAGSGDVLAGIIGAFVARIPDPFEAAAAGVFAHASAGDVAAERFGQYFMNPGDTIDALSVILKPLDQNRRTGL